MTAATDRLGMEILTLEECRRLLEGAPLGRVGFVAEDGPLVLPVNYTVDGLDIAFRSAPGSKLDAALRSADAAFEIDGLREDGGGGWSVLVRGRAERADELRVAHLEGTELPPWAHEAPRRHWILIRAEHVTGRRTSSAAPPARDPAP